jgi:hypothetical protein
MRFIISTSCKVTAQLVQQTYWLAVWLSRSRTLSFNENTRSLLVPQSSLVSLFSLIRNLCLISGCYVYLHVVSLLLSCPSILLWYYKPVIIHVVYSFISGRGKRVRKSSAASHSIIAYRYSLGLTWVLALRKPTKKPSQQVGLSTERWPGLTIRLPKSYRASVVGRKSRKWPVQIYFF